MCRPVGVFWAGACPGGHIGPPLRGGEKFPQPTRPSCVEASAMGRDGARPLRGEREWTDGGVWSPRPTGATQVMPSNGPMYLRYSFRQPNSEAEFGASVMGIGPYALRGTRDGGRHAGSSCPTGGCGEPPRLPWGAAHSGASAPAGARDGRESRQRLPQKCPATSDNPSVSLRLTDPFTQGSLGDGGSAGCGHPALRKHRNSQQSQAGRDGARPLQKCGEYAGG